MSGWKIRVKNLYDLGGGPLPRSAFDPCDGTLGDKDRNAMAGAVTHGLVKAARAKYRWQWSITQRGRDWCEGRLVLVEQGRPGVNGRGKQKLRATWISSLPRAGEIRL